MEEGALPAWGSLLLAGLGIGSFAAVGVIAQHVEPGGLPTLLLVLVWIAVGTAAWLLVASAAALGVHLVLSQREGEQQPHVETRK